MITDAILTDALRTASGRADLDVSQVDTAQGWMPDATVRWRVNAIARRGLNDARRYAVEGTAGDERETILAQRVATITVYVHTNSHEIGEGAQWLADEIATGLGSADVADILSAANASIATVGTVQVTPFRAANGDLESVATFAFDLNFAFDRTGPLIPFVVSVEAPSAVLG